MGGNIIHNAGLCILLTALFFGQPVVSQRDLERQIRSLAIDAATVGTRPLESTQGSDFSDLQKAIVQGGVWTFNSDILMTSPPPEVPTVTKLVITGACKDSMGGQGARCVIDGAGLYTLFQGGHGCKIQVHNLIIRNMKDGVHNGGCTFTASHTIFRDNLSGVGGSVLNIGTNSRFNEQSLVQIDDCNFYNNTALQGDGGAIYAGQLQATEYNPVVRIASSVFVQNRALNGSGGALAVSGRLVLYKTIFSGNSARLNGGSVAFQAGGADNDAAAVQGPVLSSINTLFSGGVARRGNGGAIAFALLAPVAGNVSALALFCSNTFAGNSAPTSRKGRSHNMVLLSLSSVAPSPAPDLGAGSSSDFGSTSGSDAEAKFRGTLSFCRMRIPTGVDILASPQLSAKWKLQKSCVGCTGCLNDCNGKGTCSTTSSSSSASASASYNPTCSCRGNYEAASACSTCLPGYDVRRGCAGCGPAYSANRKGVCRPCNGLTQIPDIEWIGNVYNVSVEASPEACQAACLATQASSEGTRCNFWAFFGKAAQKSCQRRCLLYYDDTVCITDPVQYSAPFGISYQFAGNPSFGC